MTLFLPGLRQPTAHGDSARAPMDTNLRRTPLHACHTERGAKMVAFAGWHMPIQFEGILAEHEAVRTRAGIFDVSHMGEVDFIGPNACAAANRLATNDVDKLEIGKALYTVFCQDDGGIVDDGIVYRFGEAHYRIVINASNIAKDVAHFRKHTADLVELADISDEIGLIAVQGPRAVGMVSQLSSTSLLDVPRFGLAAADVAGKSTTVARTGYTGEDGFEIFVAAADATAVWSALADAGAAPIGLGARDTLRLEARLSLYGNDIDETTNPYEAGLGWVVKLDTDTDFVGKAALGDVKANGVSRKLVGFKVTSRGIVRPGAEVLDGESVVGHVTSGGVAPTVGGSVGLAYVPKALAGPQKPLTLRQRKRTFECEQVKGPFYRRA